MDVVNYIGLFLLKNHFCYIHGLGNLELRRKPAIYEAGMLHPAFYEVVVIPVSSVDDSLANFIATNEQISISKAANALRDFTSKARIDLQQGVNVAIPIIGTFVEENGKIRFATNEYLQYQPDPILVLRGSKRVTERSLDDGESMATPQSTVAVPAPQVLTPLPPQPDAASGSINWVRVVLAVIIMLALALGAITGIHYYKGKHRSIYVPTAASSADTASMMQQQSATAMAAAAPPAAADSLHLYKFIIDSYFSEEHANKLARKMQGWGHKVEVIKEDSIYLLTIPVLCKASDTSVLIDSFTRTYNPAGVSVY